MKKILILIIVTLFSQNIFADGNLNKKAREINKKSPNNNIIIGANQRK